MKKYYSLVVLIAIVLNRFLLSGIKMTGIVHDICSIILIVLNIFLLIKFRENLKFKGLSMVLYFLAIILSRNSYSLIFIITSLVTLIGLGIVDKKIYLKVIGILVCSIFIILPMYIILPIMFMLFSVDYNDVYEDTHYRCSNNYEAYAYSAGAMDEYHYSVGKYKEIINLGEILSINYSVRNEITHDYYEDFIKSNDCKLVKNNDAD